MAGYIYDTELYHSKGPWKKHLYTKKIGDGKDAVYIYDKDDVDFKYHDENYTLNSWGQNYNVQRGAIKNLEDEMIEKRNRVTKLENMRKKFEDSGSTASDDIKERYTEQYHEAVRDYSNAIDHIDDTKKLLKAVTEGAIARRSKDIENRVNAQVRYNRKVINTRNKRVAAAKKDQAKRQAGWDAEKKTLKYKAEHAKRRAGALINKGKSLVNKVFGGK